jgi:hypothetical protein
VPTVHEFSAVHDKEGCGAADNSLRSRRKKSFPELLTQGSSLPQSFHVYFCKEDSVMAVLELFSDYI